MTDSFSSLMQGKGKKNNLPENTTFTKELNQKSKPPLVFSPKAIRQRAPIPNFPSSPVVVPKREFIKKTNKPKLGISTNSGINLTNDQLLKQKQIKSQDRIQPSQFSSLDINETDFENEKVETKKKSLTFQEVDDEEENGYAKSTKQFNKSQQAQKKQQPFPKSIFQNETLQSQISQILRDAQQNKVKISAQLNPNSIYNKLKGQRARSTSNERIKINPITSLLKQQLAQNRMMKTTPKYLLKSQSPEQNVKSTSVNRKSQNMQKLIWLTSNCLKESNDLSEGEKLKNFYKILDLLGVNKIIDKSDNAGKRIIKKRRTSNF